MVVGHQKHRTKGFPTTKKKARNVLNTNRALILSVADSGRLCLCLSVLRCLWNATFPGWLNAVDET